MQFRVGLSRANSNISGAWLCFGIAGSDPDRLNVVCSDRQRLFVRRPDEILRLRAGLPVRNQLVGGMASPPLQPLADRVSSICRRFTPAGISVSAGAPAHAHARVN